MGVILIKRKSDPAPAIQPVEAPSIAPADDTDALVAAGLLEAPKPKLVIKKKAGSYSVGDKVVVTNALFHWMKSWKVGDTGTVVRVMPPVHEAKRDPRWAILEVQLDTPREGAGIVLLNAWEVDKASPEQK